jgi:hypothetical protein
MLVIATRRMIARSNKRMQVPLNAQRGTRPGGSRFRPTCVYLISADLAACRTGAISKRRPDKPGNRAGSVRAVSL